MAIRDPDLRRTWLFGPGGDSAAHAAMLASGADALIVDLEDFTVPARRPAAREGLSALMAGWRKTGVVTSVRINALDADGPVDLAAAMAAGADVIAYPMAARAADIRALDGLIAYWEGQLGRSVGSTEILPVCETALGVVEVRAMAATSPRVRCALLGTEDLATDLAAERSAEGVELAYARQRFLLECRAAGIEPIDAPYTFRDVEGARREAENARRLGYRSKSLVLPEHANAINAALTPDAATVAKAATLVAAFEAARARGEDRALVDGLWVEVPTWRSAKRLLARAERLGVRGAG